MPRGSSAKRQQGAASNRDTRHENGLVGPGKRIPKSQRSRNDIHSDGSPGPRPSSILQNTSQSQSHSLSSTSLDTAAPPPLPSPNPSTSSANGNGNGNGYTKHHSTIDDIMSAENPRRASVAAYSDASSTDSASVSAEDAHRRIDVNAAKNNQVHRDTGPFDLALTVLRSCPLHDTIAILIILTQLSPWFLSSIYTLFTLLTFVPPPTTSSGLSINEIFDGFGAPNLWTLVGLDLFFLIIFAFMPLQDLILEFAQVVVAMTLGGGASSRGGTTHNIFLCVGIVLFNHFGHHQPLGGFPNIKTLLGPSWATTDADDPMEPGPSVYGRKTPRGLFRSVLAIHILVQGLVRYVRDWYLRRERRDLLSQSQSDPEAGKSPSLMVDPAMDGGLTPTDPDPNRQVMSSSASSKKKRKQSHQVRIRQPLWAALASTKIVMVKEYELSHATTESAGSNATDIHNLGNAPFNTQPGQVWICYVGCDTVCFNTSSFANLPPPENDDENGNSTGPSYIDKTKPFYVRVNNAIWQPTRIIPVDSGEEAGTAGTKWTGDIYGLTPMSNYECEFVSTRTDEVIFSTSIRTIPAKTKDTDAKAAAPRSQYRHESPATTLRTSIAGLESKLSDEKSRLKALRKENNRKTNAVKKEIDRLTSAVQSAGGNDEKLRQKIAQNTTQQKQSEQAMTELQEQLKELATIPEDVLTEYRKKQSGYNSEKSLYDKARSAFKSFKATIEQENKALSDDQGSLEAKRNKTAARLNKVDGEHARITDANARGLDEAQRRQQETLTFEVDVARREQEYAERLQAAIDSNTEKRDRALNLSLMLNGVVASYKQQVAEYAAAGFYEQQDPNAYNPAAAQWPQYAQNPLWSPAQSSSIPASAVPGNSTINPLFSHATFPQYPGPTGFPTRHKSRGRSSSMLSDVSGFTQSTNEDDEGVNSNGSKNASSGNLHATTSTPGGTRINVNAPPFLPPSQTQSGNPSPFAQYSYVSGGMRSPPGFPPLKDGVTRKASGSGSGTGSAIGGSGSAGSVRSGSGSSEGSNKDPASPV
ncbi:hypothetical protein N0V82_006169 [Gnomoniopsis sp. IMI 355080]|nr:hypothetical protein N0V82_006169 [Gnomoniopsis sp. IMI 355080]